MTHRHEGPRPRPELTRDLVNFVVKLSRDFFIFSLGGFAFVHELVREGDERPQILIMSAAMMGLPLIIRGDEKRQEAKPNDNKPEGG